MDAPPPFQITLQAEAAAAPPFLVPLSAASMLTSMLKSAKEKPMNSLTTGVPAIDANDGVLGGGLPRGSVVGISADTSAGMGRTLALKVMCRHLMEIGSKEKRAMIIDSTGTFDVSKLVQVAKACTTREFTKGGVRMHWRERIEVESVLERVGITRVFDLEGVWDVVGEVRGGRGEEDSYGEEYGEERDEQEEEIKERDDRQAEVVQDESRDMDHSSSRGRAIEDHDNNDAADRNLRIRLQASNQPPPPAQHSAQSLLEMEDIRSDDTQPAHPFAPSAGVLSMPDGPDSFDTPAPAARAQSSPLATALRSKEVETSSPLSSPPRSPSPSSSLHSELIIEPSPIRQNANTVLSRAYQGEAIPSSSPSEDEPEEEEELNPSPTPEVAVSQSPLPPSSPPALQQPAQQPRDAIPTDGFEKHLATDTAAPQGSSDDDTDSPSDTSSYVSSPSPERNLLPPGNHWAQASKSQEPPSILVIDSLPPLLTNLFGESSDRTSAHKQLQQLTRVLTSLTRSIVHPLTVIILNSTTTLSPAKSMEEGILRSVFADIKTVPSFGAVYDGMVDLSLLVSKIPATQTDAERLYGGGGVCRWTNFVECLRDDTPDIARWIKTGEDGDGKGGRESPRKRMNREGRWGAFDTVIEKGQEGEELMFKDLELGRKLGEYEVVHFGRRP